MKSSKPGGIDGPEIDEEDDGGLGMDLIGVVLMVLEMDGESSKVKL